MATMVRLSRDQIDQMFVEMDEMEKSLKAIHDELIELGVPKSTLNRFAKMHDRYTSGAAFLMKQRDLGKADET
jgi:Mg2+ and Co2+ transporter CorA